MSLIKEEPEDAHKNYIEIEIDTNYMILPDSPANQESVLQKTSANLQEAPTTPTTNAVLKNKKKNEQPPLYTCNECDFTTKNYKFIDRHQKTHWVVKKKGYKKNLSNQNGSKDSTEYKCPNCNYCTKNLGSLRIHMHRHDNQNAYRCTDCNFRGKTLEDLVTHHKHSKTLSCKDCPFFTHNTEQFKLHKKRHGAQWFECALCNFAAVDEDYLAKHMRIHGKASETLNSTVSKPVMDK